MLEEEIDDSYDHWNGWSLASPRLNGTQLIYENDRMKLFLARSGVEPSMKNILCSPWLLAKILPCCEIF